MDNIESLTNFIRCIKGRDVGFTTLYHVPDDKTYSQTVSSLISIASREGLKIGTGQLLIVDPANLKTHSAIRVTKKLKIDN